MAKRIDVARAIGSLKAKMGLPVKDYGVEKLVSQANRKTAKEFGLFQELADELTSRLISYSVLAQEEFLNRQNLQAPSSSKSILLYGGLGKMGGWLAGFFSSFGHEVIICDSKEGGEKSIGYRTVQKIEDLANEPDIIVLSTPISKTATLIEQLAQQKVKSIVFDVCSLKSPLLDVIEKARNSGIAITSVHPMFGPDVDVLAGRNILICDEKDSVIGQQAASLFENTVANIVYVPLQKHDEYMSYVLGFSHLLNLIFADVLTESSIPNYDMRRFSSTTFDAQMNVTTSVAEENPDLYYEIQVANRKTPKLLSELRSSIDRFEELILDGKRNDFVKRMLRSKGYLSD